MFDSLVLLTEAAEQVALSRMLLGHRQDLDIRLAADIDGLRAIEMHVLHNARLVAFASSAIAPAINLHGVTFTATSPENA